MRDNKEELLDIEEKSLHNDAVFFFDSLQGFTELITSSNNWQELVKSNYFRSEDEFSMEAFITCIEQVYKTEIQSSIEIEKLTKIKSFLHEEGEISLEEILFLSNLSKYNRALIKKLTEGGNYNDLLQMEPMHYNLPKVWKGRRANNKNECILWCIAFAYFINEPAGLFLLPSLKLISKEIEAPYSVLMNVNSLFKG